MYNTNLNDPKRFEWSCKSCQCWLQYYKKNLFLSLSRTRYKRGCWHTRRYSKSVSYFSAVFYFSIHYWKLCFWSSSFWENVHESRLVANSFNAHLAWIRTTCETFWFHHQTSFTSNSDGFHDTSDASWHHSVHKLLCFHCCFNQSNMILKV